jgi:DNA polymerase-1
MPSRKLILVDGTAVLYRAFYAIRQLSTADGTPTNALFGFIRMLRQLRDDWHPSHWIVVFDGGSPADRLELLPAYKAQRAPMPDDLRGQIALTQEYLDCAGVKWLRMERQEADDVMASLAKWASPDAEVLLATSDKDLYQLIDDSVKVIAVSGGKSEMGVQEVKAKTGVEPRLIIEWLALIGDSADNIPGVPGVGPKTASKLLAQFCSLAEMWDRIEELPEGKLRSALVASREVVDRNVKLVKLNTALDCDVGWNDLPAGEGDAGKLLVFFEKVEFGSMAKALRQPDLFDL